MTDRSPGKGRVQRSPRDVGILDEDLDDDQENQDQGDQDEDIYYDDLYQGDLSEFPDGVVEMTIINLQYEPSFFVMYRTLHKAASLVIF